MQMIAYSLFATLIVGGSEGQLATLSSTATASSTPTYGVTPTPVFSFLGSSVSSFTVNNASGVSFVPGHCGAPGAATRLTGGAYLTYTGPTAGVPPGDAAKSSIAWVTCIAQSSTAWAYPLCLGDYSRFCMAAYAPGTLAFNNGGQECRAVFNMCDGNWHHVAISYSSPFVSLFADATLLVSCQLTPLDIATNPSVFIGWSGNIAWQNGEKWTGTIFNARIFDTNLSAAAIAADMMQSRCSPSQTTTATSSSTPSATPSQRATSTSSASPSQSATTSLTPTPPLTASQWSTPLASTVPHLPSVNGTVSSLAGRLGSQKAFADGYGVAAAFNGPTTVALNAAGTIAFVVRSLRRISMCAVGAGGGTLGSIPLPHVLLWVFRSPIIQTTSCVPSMWRRVWSQPLRGAVGWRFPSQTGSG
jgi:hypothetical protein